MRQAPQQWTRYRGAGRAAAACVAILALAATLSACGNIRDTLGLGKNPPDEFTVLRTGPLTLPPDFQLRPPQPGAPRPSESSERDRTVGILLSESDSASAVEEATETTEPTETQGEAALIRQAGADDVDPEIRHIIDREFAGYASEDEGFLESLLFWRPDDPGGDVVDAEAEAKRLRRNAAEGKPVTEGATPVIKRRERALLEGIF